MPSLPSRLRPRPLDREVARLALPAFAALVAEPLFLLVDSAVVGSLGVVPLAGLGIAGTVLTTAVGVFVFLAYATTAAVARRLGADDLPSALRQGVDGMWLALGLGVVTAAAAWPAARSLALALGAGAEVADAATAYLRASLPGLPAMLVVLAATGVLRGLQDTRTPLVVAVTGALANVPLNLVLVLGLGPVPALGIAGSGLGTSIAQLGMAAALVVVVARGARRHGVTLGPAGAGVLRSGRDGLPLLVRTLTLRASILLTTAAAARSGDTALAAHQVVVTIWSALALGLDALAIAGQALTGRTLGAGDVPGTHDVLRRLLQWGAVVGVLSGLVVLAGRTLVAPVFSPDDGVRTAIAAALVVVALAQPLAAYVFVLDGVLIGAGDGRYLAVAGLVGLAVYAPLVVAVTTWGPTGTAGLVWLWGAFAGGLMAVRALTLGLRARRDAWAVVGAVR
ncbi:MATE family efflux transporter [Pseudokineococcus basanitobsidens]|uniref:MATE family efflux transporter n=1 Tax=Pseudokineococcus basanitobsidens TaxID=1926649 RepID=A0ABU8RL98_9ACTN